MHLFARANNYSAKVYFRNTNFFLELSFFIFLVSPINSSAVFQDPHQWNNPEIIRMLVNDEPSEIIPMKEYLTSEGKKIEFESEHIYLIKFKMGIAAVFKPCFNNDRSNAYAEVAAYKASQFLECYLVPPTVLRTINGQFGSLQLFVYSDIDPCKDDNFKKALTEAPNDDIANLKLFYFVFGQYDTGPHNSIILKNNDETKLVAIDNSGIWVPQHVHYGSLPFVLIFYDEKLNTNDWDKPFPFGQAQTIYNPSVEKLRLYFKDRAPESFYSTFKPYDGEQFCFVIYQNSLWRQYHACDKAFMISYTHYCPPKTLEKLRKLDKNQLYSIFSHAADADFFSHNYVQAILERRDQVINYFESCNHTKSDISAVHQKW